MLSANISESWMFDSAGMRLMSSVSGLSKRMGGGGGLYDGMGRLPCTAIHNDIVALLDRVNHILLLAGWGRKLVRDFFEYLDIGRFLRCFHSGQQSRGRPTTNDKRVHHHKQPADLGHF